MHAPARRASLLLLALAAGCSYGPEEARSRIENAVVRPGEPQLAVAVHYRRYRPATRLAAFPNGGVPRMLEQAALIHVVDLAAGTITRRARIPAPEALRSAFSVHVDGWLGERVLVTLSGCPGPECCRALRRYRHFELAPGAAPRRLAARPQGIGDKT